ncbi:hypothetical protein ACIQBJ_25050 [Kitasatospora sp. NPDC088391]|uniref:hypothetical protein n=1 Tax=Kitasatospora sp. NPDC088391 TaxID=3364074 RepID=UPI00382BFE1C
MSITMLTAVLSGAAALLVHAGRSRPLVARVGGAAAVSLLVTVVHPGGTASLGPGTAGTLEALALLACWCRPRATPRRRRRSSRARCSTSR